LGTFQQTREILTSKLCERIEDPKIAIVQKKLHSTLFSAAANIFF
jgi:hypothetical protein